MLADAAEEVLDAGEGRDVLVADGPDAVVPAHTVRQGVGACRHRGETLAPLYEDLAARRRRLIAAKRQSETLRTTHSGSS